jgi:ABC-type dipeptide/oligopeptide/nickel transport system permease component
VFSYIARKLYYGALVMIGVTMLVFFLFQGFGDPARLVMGQRADAATQENIRRELYLDQPRWKQFVFYLNDVSPVSIYSEKEIGEKKIKGLFIGGNRKLGLKIPYLRRSYQTKREVGSVLMEALPGTLVLASAAMTLAVVFGILLGVLAAVKKNTWMDTSAIFGSVLGISAPSFFMGIVIAYLFGFVLNKYTGLHMTGSLFDTDPFTGRTLQLQNLLLPAVTLGIRPLAIITQLTRGSVLDILDQDYVRTAYAKGLSKTVVVWKHVLRNALNPVVTAVTGWFAELLAGAFFVEYIFGWKGIGKVTVDALEKLDFPVVMGPYWFHPSFLLPSIFLPICFMVSSIQGLEFNPRLGRCIQLG